MIVLLVFQFGLRYVLTYRLTDTGVWPVLFGVVPVSVRSYQSIREVHTITPLESLFTFAWRVQNKIWARGLWSSVVRAPILPLELKFEHSGPHVRLAQQRGVEYERSFYRLCAQVESYLA